MSSANPVPRRATDCGTVRGVDTTPAQQAAFRARVRKADGDGCWEWTGRRQQGRYAHGLVWVKGRYVTAHCLAWELTNGPLSAGVHLYHRCGVPTCVRPDHLVVTTPGQPGLPRR